MGFPLPNQTPLHQLSDSGYTTVAVDFPVGFREAFISVRVNCQTLVPTVDPDIFECLDTGKWLNDTVLSTLVDMIHRSTGE